MTTLFFLGLVLGIGALYVAVAAHYVAQGLPAWLFLLGAPVVYVAFAVLLITLWFSLSRLFRGTPTDHDRLDLPGHVRMLLQEVATVTTSWPAMAINGLLIRDPAVSKATGASALPIVLIHGVWNNDGVWLRFRRHLARLGIGPVYTISCGPPMADIEHYARQLARRVEAVCAATGASRVILVGHSMGGLIARAYLRRGGASRVAKVVTVGTPHHGSMLAYGAVGRCLAQMRPGNAWLRELNASPAEQGVPIVSIWSRHDTMVAPQTSSHLPGARNVALTGIAHNALLRDREVFAHVVGEIERTRAQASPPAGARTAAS